MNNLSAYLRIWFAIVLGGILASGFINIVVDPNGYFDLIDLPRINLEKPEKNTGRLIKSVEVCRDEYDTIIFGNSRIETGFDPRSRWFDGGAVYNLGLGGANMYEIRKIAMYVQRCQTPKRILLGMDFMAFSTRRTIRLGFARSGFAGEISLKTHLSQILSAQLVIDSARTVWSNLRNGGDGRKSNGYNDRTGSVANQRRAFRRSLKFFMTNRDSYGDYDYGRDRLDMLRDVAFAYADAGTNVYVFIPPVHAKQLEALRFLGLYETFEQWKRDVVQVIASVNRRVTGPRAVRLWDFTGYNSVTTEAVPARGSRRQMRWYHESSHFKSETGDLVLIRMLHTEASRDVVPDDFGIALTEENLEGHLAATRRAREAYRLSQPEEVEEVANLVKATAEQRDRVRRKSAMTGIPGS